MCPGHESHEGAQLCALAGQVFAALPWPCIATSPGGLVAALVNDAFRQEFGFGSGPVDPCWLAMHLEAGDAPDEVRHSGEGGSVRRYRMTRQELAAGTGRLELTFLVPLPDDEPGSHEAVVNSFAALRPSVSLTRRESQVLDGIMVGKMNKVIAAELQISPKTVELHRANLMAKLRVHNVVELTRAVLDAPAVRRGLDVVTP